VSAHQVLYAIATMCRVLGVSPSGYYAWRQRAPSARSVSDAVLTELISEVHTFSRESYGVPRMTVELNDRGHAVNHKRVERLMREAGLAGISRRKGTRTTRPDREAQASPDLVQRDFTAQGPDELWIADITYVPTWVGFLYLAVVLDVWSRRIVGWAMASHLRTELVLEALDMALWQRRPEEVMHHSDRGSQYTSFAFGARCREAGVRPSMGAVGSCYDNAMCESFFATLECELIDRTRFPTHTIARREIFDYIEGWYNPHRRHSAINYQSPINFERAAQTELAAASG
jgi:putative transposase